MKFITVSGIDKSGKTTFIDAFNKVTSYKHYVIDRDPSNFNFLNMVQDRWHNSSQNVEYSVFKDRFRKMTDLSILLIADVEDLEERFDNHNEPELVGGLSMYEHQVGIAKEFLDMHYSNILHFNTSTTNLEDMIDTVLNNIGEVRNAD